MLTNQIKRRIIMEKMVFEAICDNCQEMKQGVKPIIIGDKIGMGWSESFNLCPKCREEESKEGFEYEK
jgi:hypothetical protein